MASDPEHCLGAFRLIEPVGRGGMGTVWSARHTDLDCIVALKFLKVPKGLGTDRMEARFAREIQAVAALEHPRIVAVYDHGRSDEQLTAFTEGAIPAGAPWMAMEFCGGGTLGSQAATSWPQLHQTLTGILEGLAHSHGRGVLHRDLKPANVLFTADGQLKLADFGLAFAMEDPLLESGSQVFGTPAYMAPEQVRGHWRDYSPSTDLFALGCLAFRLATGQRPFAATTEGPMAELLAQVESPLRLFQPAFPLPAPFGPWVRRLLQRRPDHRFRLAADALASLPAVDAVLDGERTPPPPLTPSAITDAPTIVSKPRHTIVLDEDRDIIAETDQFPTGPMPSQPTAMAPPPLPSEVAPRQRPILRQEDWRGGLERTRSDVQPGLGLFGLRRLPPTSRAEDCQRLWTTLMKVEEDQSPALVVVRGPAGCGKSHLLAWFCSRAHEVGAAESLIAHHHPDQPAGEALTAMAQQALRCQDLHGSSLRQHLTRRLPENDADELADLTRLLTPRRWFQGRRFESQEARHRVLGRLLQGQARERPLILVLDDGLVDLDALSFVRGLLEWANFPLLLAITSQREAEAVHQDNTAIIEDLLSDPRGTEVRLEPLSTKATQKLTRDLLVLDPGLAAQLARRAEGNPLFAQQLLADWVSRGLLRMGRDGFELAGAMPPITEDLHSLWMDRLAQESEQVHHQLELGAAMDGDLREEEWKAGLERAELPPLASLPTRLLKAGLLRPIDGGYRFSHGLLRESLTSRAQQAGRWARWREVCADVVLQTHEEGLCSRAERAGLYLADTSRQMEALELLIEACRGLREALEFNGADRVAKRAQQILANLDDASRAEHGMKLDLQRARLALDQGETIEGIAILERLALEREHCSNSLRLEIIYCLGLTLRNAPESQSRLRPLATEGLDLASSSHDVARALHLAAEVERLEGRPDAAEATLRRALEAMLDAEDIRAWCTLAFFHFDLLLRRGENQTAQALMERVIERSEELGSQRLLSVALINAARLQRMMGAVDAATARLRRALRITERAGLSHGTWARLDLAWCHLLRGRLDKAERSRERLRLEFEGSPSVLANAVFRALDNACQRLRSGDGQATERLEDALADLEQVDPLLSRALRADCDRLFPRPGP